VQREDPLVDVWERLQEARQDEWAQSAVFAPYVPLAARLNTAASQHSLPPLAIPDHVRVLLLLSSLSVLRFVPLSYPSYRRSHTLSV
jgi:hypothetical protein